MVLKKLLLFCLLAGITTRLPATDLSDLYSESVLKDWHGRFSETIKYNFDGDPDYSIWAQLTPLEKSRIGNITLRFPLLPEGEARGNPLAYYSAGKSITVPIFSVLFFSDISIAYAWLVKNDYDVRTISEYVAMMKYQKPARQYRTNFPPPLEALQILEGALEDSWVKETSNNVLKSAIYWIVAHELGHIYYRHTDSHSRITIEESQLRERQADQFATNIMRKLGIAPAGMTLFFMLAIHWFPNRADFRSEEEWNSYLEYETTHPFSADRLQKIADDLRINPEDFTKYEHNHAKALNRLSIIANDIDSIAGNFSDSEFQKSILFLGLATNLESLKPRSLDKTISPRKSSSGKDLIKFDGAYVGSYMHYLSDGMSEWLPVEMNLHWANYQVTGGFDFGFGTGSIEGKIVNNELYFKWRLGDSYGNGKLALSVDGASLEGIWGYEKSEQGGGKWLIGRK